MVTDPWADEATPAILVVDDDAALRRLVAAALSEVGFAVAEAVDGAAALDLLGSRDFSVVLLDAHMPGLSGFQVLARLRARHETATLAVIMVTSADGLEDRVAGLAAGADDYVTKPFSMNEIVARVRAQVRARQAWQESIEVHTRQRSVLSRALAVAGREATLEASGRVLCGALAGQSGVQSATLIRFAADGLAVSFATSGRPLWGLAPGQPVSWASRDYLLARATVGPWLERDDAHGTKPLALVGSGPVACAPLADNGFVHGLLLLGLGPTRVDRGVALSAAIDFAAVAHALLRSRLLERHHAESDRRQLKELLSARAFRPVFQPIVRLTDGELVGTEALTRFTDGSNPEARFSEATALGLDHQLEMETLIAALKAVDSMSGGGWIGVNVSPALMLEESDLRSVLVPRDHEIVLEISEREAVTDYVALRSAVSSVGTDIRLSVDDAGAGFASLRHILHLEPAFVKLDRTWVHGIGHDPARQALVAGIRHFALQTGAELIAEGVEQEEERMALIDLNVEYGQGYLLGRPEEAVTRNPS